MGRRLRGCVRRAPLPSWSKVARHREDGVPNLSDKVVHIHGAEAEALGPAQEERGDDAAVLEVGQLAEVGLGQPRYVVVRVEALCTRTHQRRRRRRRRGRRHQWRWHGDNDAIARTTTHPITLATREMTQHRRSHTHAQEWAKSERGEEEGRGAWLGAEKRMGVGTKN